MAISVRCANGHKLTAKEKLAGQSVTCPKCGARVNIPHAAAPAPAPAGNRLDEALHLEPASARADDDPLDSEFRIQDEGPTPARPAPQKTARPTRPTSGAGKKPPTKSKSSTAQADGRRLSPRTLAITGAAGVLTLIVAIVLVIVFSKDDQPITRPSTLPPGMADSTAAPAAPNTTADAQADRAAPVEPAPPARTPDLPASPLDLVEVQTDPRMRGFQLPGATWAAAYDEPTGSLAVTHDASGIVIYDVDYLLESRPAVRAILPTDGLPTAVCFKVVNDKRLLVLAGKDAPTLHVHDADSLEKVGAISLENIQYVDFLAGSLNAEDPYVYYSTDGQSATNPASRQDPNRLGRVDLVRGSGVGEISNVANRSSWNDVAVSADGELLYTGRNFDRQASVMAWSGQIDQWGGVVPRDIGIGQMGEGQYVADPLGRVCAVDTIIYSRHGWRVVKNLDFEPRAFFRDRPVVAGAYKSSDKIELVVASANDYRRLESIAIPGDWVPPRDAGVPDFRLRPQASMTIEPFFSMFADDQRQLVLAVCPERLALLPLTQLNLPREDSLIVRNRLPSQLIEGQEITLELDIPSRSATVEIVTIADDDVNKYRQVVASVGVAPPRVEIPLAASVNSSQNILFIPDVSRLRDAELPLTIQIDDELMTVTALDDFKDALMVERTNGAAHSVSSPIIVVPDGQQERPTAPVLQGRTLKWRPATARFPKQTVHFKTKSGKLEHHWYWDVLITPMSIDCPFYAQGIEFDSQNTRAVVWGRPPGTAAEFPVAVWDSATQRFIQQATVPHAVKSAAIDETGVYLAYDHVGPAQTGLPAPTQIVRLNATTLQPEAEAPVPSHCHKLQVIGGKYLAAFGMEGQTFRFSVPDLQVAAPQIPDLPGLALAGRVRDQWIWDGMVWDQAMARPQLLLVPVHFGARSVAGGPVCDAGPLGKVHLHTQGAAIGTWFAGKNPIQSGYALKNYPGSVMFHAGNLLLYSWADSTKYAPPGAPPTEDLVLDPVEIADDSGPQPADKTASLLMDAAVAPERQYAPEYMAQDSDRLYAVGLGQIVTLPLDKLLLPYAPFSLEERQSTFVLKFREPNELKYSAPEAAKYYLQVQAHRDLNESGGTPLARLTSDDGTFSVRLDKSPQLVGELAMGLRRSLEGDEQSDPAAALAAYVTSSTAAFRELVGRDPQGIPLPVYVMVVAERADGRRTGMAHACLVEIPITEVRAQFSRAGLRLSGN